MKKPSLNVYHAVKEILLTKAPSHLYFRIKGGFDFLIYFVENLMTRDEKLNQLSELLFELIALYHQKMDEFSIVVTKSSLDALKIRKRLCLFFTVPGCCSRLNSDNILT